MLNTLRGRLTAAMITIFILAVGVSSLLDRLEEHAPPSDLVEEPYQDALVLACFSLPALLLIWLVSSWSLRPVARASREAQLVGPRDPAARISRAGLPAELVPLVDAVNSALGRMADAMEAERRFTENAAHELRTPLAILGLRLQRARLAQDKGEAALDWPAIEQDLAQMNRLVGQLLNLARQEHAAPAGGRADWPVVNLSRVAREACAAILPLAEARGRALAIDLPHNLPARGQAPDLHDALCNLLENAVLHGDGAIRVQGRVEAGRTVLIVSDEGPGVREDEKEAVFARFHKHSRSEGSGLGLAIVREIIRAHGGTVGFAPGPVSRIALSLPAPPSSAS